MIATAMAKTTEQISNPSLLISFFNRHGTKVTIIRKSRKGVPIFNRRKLLRMDQEQREIWFAAKTIRCNLSEKAKIRKRLDTLRTSKAKIQHQSIYVPDITSASLKKLERVIRLIKQEKTRRMPV